MRKAAPTVLPPSWRPPGDLFRGIPGVTVMEALGSTHIRMMRGRAMSLVQGNDPSGCAPAVYVQGMRYGLGVLPPMDPHAIRGIEVYRGLSETPVEYGGASPGAHCGVVLIWMY